jgi:hypothetical protein
MTKASQLCMIALVSCTASLAAAADSVSWPSTLPVYDHIVIVVEENKDFEQILGGRFDAPYISKLAAEGATFERMFAEEHFSQGNYFWLFSGSNQNVGFLDQVPSKANHPDYPFKASNLGEQLIKKRPLVQGILREPTQHRLDRRYRSTELPRRPMHLRTQACPLDQLRECPQRHDGRHLVESAICRFPHRLYHPADRRFRHPQLES